LKSEHNRALFPLIGIAVLLLVLLVGGLASCSKVAPGHVGIKVSNFGSDAGVQAKALSVGWYLTAPGTNVYQYPIYTSTYTWTLMRASNPRRTSRSTFRTRTVSASRLTSRLPTASIP
jgi:hypothetical protein